MAPLERAMVVSYRLCIVTVALSVTRLRLYIILQIFTFNKIKKRKSYRNSNETKENVQRSSLHTTLAESAVITAIAPLRSVHTLIAVNQTIQIYELYNHVS